MNAADLIIIGIVAGMGLIGLRTGFLKPISGIGGLVIGIMLAVQNSAEVATMLVDYIEDDTARTVAAFGAIVIASTVVVRLVAWMVKKVFKTLMMGWFDRVAGALGGAALGIVLAGTVTYLLTGADLDPTRDALATSRLAPEVSRATVLSSSQPWCSQIEGGNVEGAACTDIAGLFSNYLGESISQQVNNVLGGDIGSLTEIVQTTFGGSPEEVKDMLNSGAASGLFPDDSSALVDAIGGSFGGKSPEEIASMVSASGAIAGAFPDKSPEEIASLVSSMLGEGGSLEGKSAEEVATLISSGELPEIPQETIDALIKSSAAAEEPQQTEAP